MKIIFILVMSVFLNACKIPGFQANAPTPALNPQKANSELLLEMFQVTFNKKEIEDRVHFLALHSALNQGASLEGIYHGLVMGSHYRVLESKAKAASPEAIQFFAREMSELQSGMKNPTLFYRETAKQYPTIDYPDGSVGDSAADQIIFDQKKKSPKEMMEETLQNFIGATPFTLKRVIADEVLKKMDELKNSPEDLAQWYAALVLKLNGANTDFGLPKRNSPDFDFHSRFAKTMPLDRVKWEVLNRYQRVLNRLE